MRYPFLSLSSPKKSTLDTTLFLRRQLFSDSSLPFIPHWFQEESESGCYSLLSQSFMEKDSCSPQDPPWNAMCVETEDFQVSGLHSFHCVFRIRTGHLYFSPWPTKKKISNLHMKVPDNNHLDSFSSSHSSKETGVYSFLIPVQDLVRDEAEMEMSFVSIFEYIPSIT